MTENLVYIWQVSYSFSFKAQFPLLFKITSIVNKKREITVSFLKLSTVICYKNYEHLYLLLYLIRRSAYFRTVFVTVDVLLILLSSLEKLLLLIRFLTPVKLFQGQCSMYIFSLKASKCCGYGLLWTTDVVITEPVGVHTE